MRVFQRDERVVFQVQDNGVGIAESQLTTIFSHGFTTKKIGHGFGLHSAANAAAEMGGSMRADSEGLGSGATLTLEVPLVQQRRRERMNVKKPANASELGVA